MGKKIKKEGTNDGGKIGRKERKKMKGKKKKKGEVNKTKGEKEGGKKIE